MLSSLSLDRKVVMVTGATKGIGYGIAKGMAEAGADLIVVSRHQEDCEHVASEIAAMGREALPVAADMRNIESIDRLVDKSIQKFRRIDVLVNNAGTAHTQAPEEITEEEWDSVLDLNLKGAFFAAQKVGKRMINQMQGKIINIGSIFSFTGDGNIAAYCSSKGGVLLMTKSLALAWAKYNIQVNLVAPGYIETKMNSEVLHQERVYKHLMRKTPAKRLGQVEDLIGSVVYLSSPASNFTTGQSIVVDGGWLAG